MWKLIAVGVAAGIVGVGACGGGGGSPTVPTPPVPAPTPPSAQLRVVAQDLLLPDWPCPSGACRYGFDFENLGPDCAAAVRGTLRLFRADRTTLLAHDAWAIDPSRVVRPQETVRVEDGEIPVSAFEVLRTANEDGHYSVAFVFDAVRCS